MSIRDNLLPVVARLRQLPTDFGLRRYTVKLRRRVWTGRVGVKPLVSETDVEILPRPKVREVTTKEIADSGGMWRQGDYKIDKITPAFIAPTNGGWAPSQLNLRPSASNEDVCVILTGDEGSFECQLIEFHFERSFTYWMVARRSVTNRG